MSMHPLHNYFKEYKGDCDCWVETGTFAGGGVTLSVQAGFTEIYTVDLKENKDPNYQHGLKSIYYYFGDSAEFLETLLPKLKGKKPQVWLDAHSQMTEGEEENYPLLRELKVIKKYFSDATILIDDFLYMSHPDVTGWSKKIIEEHIKEINPNYKIEYLPNPIMNNILIARI